MHDVRDLPVRALELHLERISTPPGQDKSAGNFLIMRRYLVARGAIEPPTRGNLRLPQGSLHPFSMPERERAC
jgi:hypothetical protein